MEINLDNLEILSPAGNSECFFADINSGADAIYLGLSEFNARIKAENFTNENIGQFVQYAHLFGVKIYITVNTLINDSDFPKLIEMIKILVTSNVDAFIVQDFGIAFLLKKCFKNIVIHASTQMGIHNLEGAKIAEKMGISRVVLSRETKLQDIIEIHKNTNLEIEYFVQGALCVAFSGNCYLSSVEKGMSGNEGKCLQLCRLPYTNNLTNETNFNLSARDLGLLENLPLLIDAGVTSFKIEGRMRHSGYCAIATKIYKDALIRIKNNDFTKEWINTQYKILRETFSRGEFNRKAYLDLKNADNIIFKDYQNHIGLEVGKVLSVTPFKTNLFKVRVFSSVKLNQGDGLKIIDKNKKIQIASLGIGNINCIQENIYEFITKYKFNSGFSIFLTQNSSLESEFLQKNKKLPVNIKVVALSGKQMTISCCYNSIQVDYQSEFTVQKAEKQPLSEKDFKNQFEKLNETPFYLNNFSLSQDGVFIPKSILNACRRKCIELLKEKIIAKNKKNNVIFSEKSLKELQNQKINLTGKNIAIIDENFDYISNSEKLNNFDVIVFSPQNYNKKIIIDAYNKLKNRFALNLPTILNFNDKTILNDILSELPKNIFLFANNIYALSFSNEYNVIVSPLLNIKNAFALKFLSSLNIKIICASIESSKKFLSNENIISFFSGYFPLMAFSHCPFKTIYQNKCENCKYQKNLKLSNTNLGKYKVSRIKIFNCYFELIKEIEYEKQKFCLINLCNH